MAQIDSQLQEKLLSYLNTIPSNQSSTITLKYVEPVLKGLRVVYTLDDNSQRYSKTIPYNKL